MKITKIVAAAMALLITGSSLSYIQKYSPNTAIADSSGYVPLYVEGSLGFAIYDNKTATVAYCNSKASGKIVIPSKVKGIPVTGIDKKAFFDNDDITTVVIPDTVKIIDSYAFEGCANLEYVDFGNSLETIGDYAFSRCLSLKEANMPASLKSLGTESFSSCSRMKKATIGGRVKRIEAAAFSGCDSLESVYIPDSVQEIGTLAFWLCTSLKNITIPRSVTLMEYAVFEDCPDLKSIKIMNPKCEIIPYIYKDSAWKYWTLGNPKKTTVIGYANSTAEEFTNESGHRFVEIGGLGDVNEDGLINAIDASDILSVYAKTATKKTKPTSDELSDCDVNKDGSVNAVDASYVLSYYAYTSTNKDKDNDKLDFVTYVMNT